MALGWPGFKPFPAAETTLDWGDLGTVVARGVARAFAIGQP